MMDPVRVWNAVMASNPGLSAQAGVPEYIQPDILCEEGQVDVYTALSWINDWARAMESTLTRIEIELRSKDDAVRRQS